MVRTTAVYYTPVLSTLNPSSHQRKEKQGTGLRAWMIVPPRQYCKSFIGC